MPKKPELFKINANFSELVKKTVDTTIHDKSNNMTINNKQSYNKRNKIKDKSNDLIKQD